MTNAQLVSAPRELIERVIKMSMFTLTDADYQALRVLLANPAEDVRAVVDEPVARVNWDFSGAKPEASLEWWEVSFLKPGDKVSLDLYRHPAPQCSEVAAQCSEQLRTQLFQTIPPLPLAGGTMTGAINEAPIARVNLTASTIGAASAGANTIQVDPGGGTSITSFGPAPDSGVERWVILGADGITLVNSSNLIIPGGADIIGKTRDRIKIVSISATAWLVLNYVKADGTPVITPSDSSKVSTSSVGAANGVAPLGADSKVPAAYLPAGNVFRIENIAATSVGQTSFAIPNGYTAGAIIPFFKGPVLAPADYTATDGANVVLAVGADAIGDVLTVVVLGALRAQDDALLQYTVASLPAASANAFKQRWCTNMAGRAGPVYSDGTNWRRYVDDSIVTV